jgi:hypothetical protein
MFFLAGRKPKNVFTAGTDCLHQQAVILSKTGSHATPERSHVVLEKTRNEG